MTEENKKEELDKWLEMQKRWLHEKISLGKIYDVIEMAFLEAINIGFEKGIKAKINTTTISDAPLNLDQTWHDLRKNPEDTPPLGVVVMTYDFINDTYRFTVGAEKEWYMGRQIAWRKLPEPPEE